ncbi:formate dehydrogenase accessory sulfurtransferase FdhD [Caulobacter hibisci]|uniref:Sulfur carrier protein FdhD n=1 Tax=Caulobacter hibisci TaxID=2035993 RepID=A0ABS0SSK7_9CAUL|nr:formate dehydrogenase accessory sulfurtransferase FdhD [Caulobacter hibisci]MBI1682630.1 formate dehydrogenase accessory sulfurtransferase FdhD [Caulobacter hibisci]
MSDASARLRPALAWRAPGRSAPADRWTPSETAVGLSFDGRPHAVLMATPAEVDDLARGFVITEDVARADEIRSVEVTPNELGLLVDVRLAEGAGRRKARPRNLEGRSSCGLCGVQRLADAVRDLPPAAEGVAVAHEAITKALADLEEAQALGRSTRATHAAAFCDPAGRVVLLREDVGRHNALDKLAGAMAREGRDASAGFVLVTSRCSFEMVEKAVRMGAAMIVAVSAPTDLAVRRAEEAGLTLVALARADGHMVFSRPDRLVEAVLESA